MGWTIQGSSSKSKRFFLSPKCPDWLWGPLSCQSMVNSFLRVKQTGCEVNHSPPLTTEVKTEWSYTCTPPKHIHGICKQHYCFPTLFFLPAYHGSLLMISNSSLIQGRCKREKKSLCLHFAEGLLCATWKNMYIRLQQHKWQPHYYSAHPDLLWCDGFTHVTIVNCFQKCAFHLNQDAAELHIAKNDWGHLSITWKICIWMRCEPWNERRMTIYIWQILERRGRRMIMVENWTCIIISVNY